MMLTLLNWQCSKGLLRMTAVVLLLALGTSQLHAAEKAKQDHRKQAKQATEDRKEVSKFASAKPEAKKYEVRKQVIGAVATVEETQSDLKFAARVDTGATTTSIHVDEMEIQDPEKDMAKNLGKTIRFRINNHRGKGKWIKRKITEISVIKTSEDEEVRYKVPFTLDCQGVKKRVLVSLNDRSHMKYPLLLGRNYLEGHFLVDVELTE